jgi:hypothetical protein
MEEIGNAMGILLGTYSKNGDWSKFTCAGLHVELDLRKSLPDRFILYLDILSGINGWIMPISLDV